MIDGYVISRLIKAQEIYAVKALKNPQTKDLYEYGYRAGVVEGFRLAVQELENMVAEAKSDRDPL